MRFISWLKLQTHRSDYVGTFANWAIRNKKFPLSSDPALLKLFLIGNGLKGELYGGFQMAFVEYALTQENQLPKNYRSPDDLKKLLL